MMELSLDGLVPGTRKKVQL